jgi:NAD-dependent dihydropyrimidine dehydrogenase PreA subunit
MIRTLAVALLGALAARPSPAAAEGKSKIAVLVLQTGEAEADLADNLTEVLVAELASKGTYEIVGKEEFRGKLGVGGEQAASTCLEQPACLGRVGAALGLSKVAAGTIGKRGNDYAFNLNLIDVATARIESRVFKLVSGGVGGLVATLQDAARQLLQPKAEPGAVKVASPAAEGARVYVDDAFIGTTPVRSGNLEAGKHRLRVEKDGFHQWRREVEVPAGATLDLALKLNEMPPRRVWPTYVAWVALGAAVVTAATGTFFGVLSQESPSGTSRALLLQDVDRKAGQARTATILFGVAGGLAATSAVMLVVFRKDIFGRRAPGREAALVKVREKNVHVPWVDWDECTGCNLCSLVCPVQGCITMVDDTRGKPFESWNDRIAKGTNKVPGGLRG